MGLKAVKLQQHPVGQTLLIQRDVFVYQNFTVTVVPLPTSLSRDTLAL